VLNAVCGTDHEGSMRLNQVFLGILPGGSSGGQFLGGGAAWWLLVSYRSPWQFRPDVVPGARIDSHLKSRRRILAKSPLCIQAFAGDW